LSLRWFGEDAFSFDATNPAWEKWTPSTPTSPHWYGVDELGRLVAAYLTHDMDAGRVRTIREFIAEFRGLSSTAKQKKILDSLGFSRANLSALANGDDLDHRRIEGLLAAMQLQSKPVSPRLLGAIGEEHLRASMGHILDGSFSYKKREGCDQDGLPQVTEVAFGAQYPGSSRKLVAGVNWSASVGQHPFRSMGRSMRSLDSLLADFESGDGEPVKIVVHVAHPRVRYADRGKSSVVTGGSGYGR
jgi:DNA topoisomerase VI subunit B